MASHIDDRSPYARRHRGHFAEHWPSARALPAQHSDYSEPVSPPEGGFSVKPSSKHTSLWYGLIPTEEFYQSPMPATIAGCDEAMSHRLIIDGQPVDVLFWNK